MSVDVEVPQQNKKKRIKKVTKAETSCTLTLDEASCMTQRSASTRRTQQGPSKPQKENKKKENLPRMDTSTSRRSALSSHRTQSHRQIVTPRQLQQP